MKRICFSVLLTLISPFALANVPSPNQIYNSISNKELASSQDMEISDTAQVRLKNGELGYLSSITYENSARNFWGGYVLTRPQTGKSMIIDFGGQYNDFKLFNTFKSYDVVLLGSSSSGQGTTDTTLYLVTFDGWKPIIKYKTEFGNNSGTCGTGTSSNCRSSYKFINYDGIGNFIETELAGTAPDYGKPYKYSYKVKPLKIN